MVFGGFSRGFQELVHYSCKFIRVIRIINFMLKKGMNEKICRDCGRPIIGRRIDVIICKDCRRRDQEESSRRIKEKEKEERIWNKVERSGVKRDIEYNKVREILENLEKGPLEEKETYRDTMLEAMGLKWKTIGDLGTFGMTSMVEEINSGEMKPFWEFLDKKINEALEKEEIKRKEEQNNKEKFRNTFDTLS